MEEITEEHVEPTKGAFDWRSELILDPTLRAVSDHTKIINLIT